MVIVVSLLAVTAVNCAFALLVPLEIDPQQKKLFLIPAVITLLLILLFKDLTVTVNDQEVDVRYGVGLIKKTIPLDQVESCRKVRNHWIQGWGIRYGRGYVMYTISGLDAVELVLKGKARKVRIGTDEPDELCEAINSRLK
jgi:hypothetical protein